MNRESCPASSEVCGLPNNLSFPNLPLAMCICREIVPKIYIDYHTETSPLCILISILVQHEMQAMLQRTLSHSFAMSSGCKGAPPQSCNAPNGERTYAGSPQHSKALFEQTTPSSLSIDSAAKWQIEQATVYSKSRCGLRCKLEGLAGGIPSLGTCRCSHPSQLTFVGNLGNQPMRRLHMQGLAHCFEKNENGKLADCFVIEPISANSLEV